MSIFRDTFSPEVQDSLNIRQNAMVDRTPQNLQYLNSRNAWIRMTSAVNVDGTNTLAKQYVLLGGTLNQNTVTLPGGTKVDAFTSKAGVGYNDSSKSYSNTTPSGKTHRLGIRPMPGITSLDIKSLTAYGSLREVTVNFQCWDIRQLEDLELLYMRPGYTVLVEWGWLPYLWKDSNGNTTLQRTLPEPFYDILNKEKTNRTKIFRELYEKSKRSGGNYDAMYGYIKNYQWSARADGGYDCQTTIISTGEIIESLKVNYVSPNLTLFNDRNYTGLLNSEFSSQGNTPSSIFASHYQKNILAGIWAEAYYKLRDPNAPISPTSTFSDNKYELFQLYTNQPSNNTLQGEGSISVYITLEAAFDVINKYIIPRSNSPKDKEPLIYLSLTSSAITNTTGSDLYCIAHPVQVSANPSICLINSPLWEDKGQVTTAVSGAATNPITTQVQSIANRINASRGGLKDLNGVERKNFLNAVLDIKDIQIFNAVEGALSPSTTFTNIILNEWQNPRILKANVTFPQTLQEVIDHLKTIQGLNVGNIKEKGVGGYTYLESISISNPQQSSTNLISLAANGQDRQGLATLNELSKLRPFFYDTPYNEIGIIKNIYVNVEFLYKKALDGFIESQDTKEKDEINLYNYIKSVIREIQSAIGNLNNFEIHVDPTDNNVARVIDVNYAQPDKAKKTQLFELQVHNLKSVVRNYSLQSKIFPNQSSLIAIGSQAKGGQLGMQNNTMIDFNKTLIDRITPEKIFGGEDSLTIDKNNKTTPVAGNLAGIIKVYAAIKTPPQNSTAANPNAPQVSTTDTVNYEVLYSTAKNNLRDLIVYFQSIPDLKSSSANRNIIPIQFSFEMDGIGGLVIGHLFTINQDILPRGYKREKGGPDLAQTVTRIAHTISNNDWITKVEALNIALNNKSGSIEFKDLNLTDVVNQSLQGAFANNVPKQSNQPISNTGICGDVTDRSGKWKNLVYQQYVQTTVSVNDVANYLKSNNTYSQSIKRATYAVFRIESEGGNKGINNNYIGLQTDGGGFIPTDTNYVTGTTSVVDRGGACRAFATYSSWQQCVDHLLAIMESRLQSGNSTRKMVPTNPNDAAYFGQGYAKNWVGLTDLIAIGISSRTGEQYYNEAIKKGI